MKPQVPSRDSSQDTLSTFLAIPVFRKLWIELLDSTKKLKNLEANVWFLVQCLNFNVIPQSFVSKIKPKNSKSFSFKKEWSNVLHRQALDLIQKTVEEDKVTLSNLLEDIQSKMNVLTNLIQNNSVQDEFKQRFLSKASGFQDYAMEIKVK